MSSNLKAPYPYFGGKSRIADLTWDRLGDTPNFIDPFFGSNAFLLARPHWNPATGVFFGKPNRIETVNDANGYIANFWRAARDNPVEVARHADNPVNEADLHARHQWLINQAMHTDFLERLIQDPDFYNAKIAGWWVWGASCWIGKGWCDLNKVPSKQVPHIGGSGRGVNSHGVSQQMPRLSGSQGVNRQMPHLSDAGTGVHRQRPHLSDGGTGVHRQRPHTGNSGMGTVSISQPYNDGLEYVISQLAHRMRHVRVCCGNWDRVLGPSVTTKLGMTAVVLDPPYDTTLRDGGLYAIDDEGDTPISKEVREWALEWGEDPLMRIALFGYVDEHGPHMPDTWECVPWKATGGYGSQRKDGTNDNPDKERVWFSPNCLYRKQLGLFSFGGNDDL